MCSGQDHHFKRMEIEKKEKNLEDMLHEYRVGKEDFEERREAIFNECVRWDMSVYYIFRLALIVTLRARTE